jgi:sterol desaturase/sphingolipid hydroxylase (fatty acid hydroxylase superfamily)
MYCLLFDYFFVVNAMNTTHIKPKHTGTRQLFKNPILEKLSRTHIAVPTSIYLLIGALLLVYAYSNAQLPGNVIVLLFLTGMITFTFVEYWLHREIYHMSTRTAWRSKLQYTIHGVHHEYPKDKTRLALPPVLGILATAILLGICYVLMGEYAYAFFPGFLYGYTGYLFVHYLIHAYPAPQNIFKFLWVNHAIHHYKNGKVVFGVSSPLWDYVFGTMPKEKVEIPEELQH